MLPAQAQRNGRRATFFDPAGFRYVGEWKRDRMDGQGLWTDDDTVYEGGWEEGRRHGYGRLYTISEGKGRRLSSPLPDTTTNAKSKVLIYEGEWKNDLFDGVGTRYYPNGSCWRRGKRNGMGRLHDIDGSVYDGHWDADVRRGQGTWTSSKPDIRNPRINLEDNGNQYVGEWMADKKHGQGKFIFPSKNLTMVGVWVEDECKCSELVDTDPKIGLAKPDQVLDDAKEILAPALMAFCVRD